MCYFFESHFLNQLFYISFWLRRAFQETLVVRDLRHQSFLGENIVHLVFQELYYVLTSKYSAYSHEFSHNLDLARLTLQSRIILAFLMKYIAR